MLIFFFRWIFHTMRASSNKYLRTPTLLPHITKVRAKIPPIIVRHYFLTYRTSGVNYSQNALSSYFAALLCILNQNCRPTQPTKLENSLK